MSSALRVHSAFVTKYPRGALDGSMLTGSELFAGGDEQQLLTRY